MSATRNMPTVGLPSVPIYIAGVFGGRVDLTNMEYDDHRAIFVEPPMNRHICLRGHLQGF